jgi:hypothetical protein
MTSDKELRKNGGNAKSWLREMFFDRKRLAGKFVTFLEDIYTSGSMHCGHFREL